MEPSIENLPAMRQSWQDLCLTWSVEHRVVNQTFGDLARLYSSPGRFYHTLDHIRNVLELVEKIGPTSISLNAIKLAAWLHDVIYDSKAADNEERSADYATEVCRTLAIPNGDIVASLILKTKTHLTDDDLDAQILIDADLAILGACENDYQIYAAKIRQEYAWVPEPDYRKGRRQVLERFLERPRIYHLLVDLETPARENIAAEVVRLSNV